MDEFRDHNGIVRRLARLEPTGTQLRMRSSRTNIQTYRTQADPTASPLIPESDWRVIDNRAIFDSRFMLNQSNVGGCVGYSDACAEMKVQYMTTGELLTFSGAFIYALICGGRDNGAVITEAMGVSETIGQVLKSQFDLQNLVFRGVPQTLDAALLASAAKYKSRLSMTVGSWQEVCTAIQMGFMVQFPIQVGNHFENFDQYGIAGFDNGYGNHSVHADGMIKLPSGIWALTMMNTWGLWGPNRDGRCLLTQNHIDGCGSADDAFAHCTVLSAAPDIQIPASALAA